MSDVELISQGSQYVVGWGTLSLIGTCPTSVFASLLA